MANRDRVSLVFDIYMEEEKIKIIYEDDNLIVLDKPVDWVTTKENNKSEKNIERWLETNRKNDLTRNGIVHRLDKGTSGVLLVAKNEKTLNYLKDKFKKRKIIKKYTALIEGDLPLVGEMNLPIGRSKYGFGKFKVSEEGKNALTKFRVIKKYDIDGKKVSLVDIDLMTGRTHQIRVHFSYLGWPIVGDKLYGGKIPGRIRLHCREIHFDDYKFVSPDEER